MRANLTNIAINLILVDGVLIAFSVMQAIMDWNFLPIGVEQFAYAIFGSFQVFVVMAYFAALLSELQRIGNSLQEVKSRL